MAAVRFTLLVAVLLSLMLFATPLNAAAIGLSDCRVRLATCFRSHRYCEECVRDCELAALHVEKYSAAALLWSTRCKRVVQLLAARGEAGY